MTLSANKEIFMAMEKLTLKAQEVLQEAQKLATKWRHQYVDAAHLLAACVEVPEQLVPEILEKAGVPPAKAREAAEAALGRLASVTGGHVQLAAGQSFREALVKAEEEAKGLGDEYLSTEHFLLA